MHQARLRWGRTASSPRKACNLAVLALVLWFFLSCCRCASSDRLRFGCGTSYRLSFCCACCCGCCRCPSFSAAAPSCSRPSPCCPVFAGLAAAARLPPTSAELWRAALASRKRCAERCLASALAALRSCAPRAAPGTRGGSPKS